MKLPPEALKTMHRRLRQDVTMHYELRPRETHFALWASEKKRKPLQHVANLYLEDDELIVMPLKHVEISKAALGRLVAEALDGLD